MSTLSPQAQAVLDAAYHGVPHETAHTLESRIAAALRAAADQVVPYENKPAESSWQVGFLDAWAQIRRDLLAIAAELEQQ